MKQLNEFNRRMEEESLFPPIRMKDGVVRFIDQRKLPQEEAVYSTTDVKEICEAIKSMAIRGSGAIGISGLYGMLLTAIQTNGDKQAIKETANMLKATRPTAINLSKTVDELSLCLAQASAGDLLESFTDKCCEILQRQLDFEYALGAAGAEKICDGDCILTHCHSGALAGSGFGGRALSVIRAAHNQGKQIHVYTSETRPYLQGARITAYELSKFGIPHTLITDGMSGYLMRLGKIQKVVVGSDRVAANGDLINKIGTYMHALAAKANGIPFYTATASHTIDFALDHGMDLEVEFRDENEVRYLSGTSITDHETHALYPAFDVTPNELISGIITEAGVITAPYQQNMACLKTNCPI